MSIRKTLSCFITILAMFLFSPEICLCSPSEITSILQLNNPRYRVGCDSSGPVLERVRDNLPDAENFTFNDLPSECLALTVGKIDALIGNEPEVISAMRNGLENVRLLTGYLGDPIPTAAGISDRSKIPSLKEKFNAFIAGLKADGTLSAMYKRWVYDNDTNMPVIDVPEKSDIHLTVGTTGITMPFSFFISNTVTGFDVELARRFAAHIGATVEFKIYSFGSILMALKSGAIDIALSNLYVTPETAKTVTFSDIIFTLKCIAIVRDDVKMPAIPEPETEKFSAFNGKRIGVFTGAVQDGMVKEIIPGAEILYFDALANVIGALVSGKIDAAAVDETIASEAERTNHSLTHMNELLGETHTAFLLPKSQKNNPLADEVNEYIRRIKSDGTLDEIRAIWFGDDDSKKIVPDYSKFPDTKGTIRIAADNETPIFSYIKDGKLTGYDVDIIVRFCMEKGYRPEISMINFTGVIPAVSSGKCDMGIGGISITPERAESVRFSEPVCSVKSLMLLKSPEQTLPSQKAGTPRRPKYSTFSELDGKPIGVQTGVDEWATFAEKTFPHSKIVYYYTFTDIIAALNTHKIEAFFVDEPVYNLMATENKNLAKIDEKVDDSFNISYGFAKTEKGTKLCAEMSEYISRLQESGELAAIIAAWEGADESAKTIPNYKSFPANNGVLRLATEGEYPPFNYYRGKEIVGLDIDIAARFCEAYGYGLEVTAMMWDGIISAVISGKHDFACLVPTEAHGDDICFSTPYTQSRSIVACLKAEDSPSDTLALRLAGKKVGVQMGTTCTELVPARIPSAELAYYNSFTDSLAALRAGKIEAVCTSLPSAIFAENEDPTLERINPPLRETYLYPIFSRTDKARRLCEEYSDFLKTLWEDGTIDALNAKWLGADDSIKTVDDYSNLPAMNGTVMMAVDASIAPFAYVKANVIVGYDVDLAVMFCKSKGYGLVVENMPLTGVIASVKSGKSDFTQSMNKTEERAENTLFTSTPSIKSGNVLLTVKPNKPAKIQSLSDLAGKRIGTLAGTTHPEIAKEHIPSAEILQFNSMADILAALRAGKIDAVCTSDPIARFMMTEHDDIAYFGTQLTYVDVAPIFPKTEKGEKLRSQYSEFIRPLWNDGTIHRLESKWFSPDESKRVIEDYSSLPNNNGTLKMAVDLEIAPFVFMKNGKILGYDVDLAVRFCKAYGYGLEVMPMSFGAIIPAVQSGKCDFAASSITHTKEREESVLFSFPNARTGNVILALKSELSGADTRPLSEFAGKNVGLMIGSDSAKAIEDKIPGVKLRFFDSPSYILPALRSDRIDAFYCSVPTAMNIIQNYNDLAYIPDYVSRTNHTAMFPDTDKGRKLCREYEDFLNVLWEDGTIDRLSAKWMNGGDESKQVTEDYSTLPAENGTLTLAVTEGLMPFVFYKNNRIQGYDIDLALMFCRAKGYGLNIEVMNHNGVLSSLKTGKCDFSYSVQWTEDRAMTVLFSSVPNAITGSILVVRKSEPVEVSQPASPATPEYEPSFWEDIASSFSKTFIREDRWKLFADGIMNTMIITVSAIFCGMLLGFAAFMFCRTGSVVANVITKFSVWLIKGTPIVVLLMILYYIIFGHVNISGIIVSIIAFTLTFGTSVYRMLTFGTGAVDWGQTEAAYALGFTDMQTFFTVILPQAAIHFMPSLREEVTMLIKSTSVVGYIAVQDLTKMGDIVRSRTYEAFFPLIAVAVIYFVLAGMLNIIVTAIEIRITPSGRKPEDILRGIDTSRGDENHD